MVDGHPVVWAVVVVAASGLAMGATEPWALGTLVASLLVAGFVARGPRLAAFTHALLLAFLGALVVLAWALLPSTGGSLLAGLADVLALAAVLLGVGLAGQLVSARGWLSLSRALLGPLAPAVGWVACAGEASAELEAQRRQRRGRGPSWAAAVWLLACRDVARSMPGVSPRVLLAWRSGDVAQLVAAVALLSSWLLAPRLGAAPVAVASLLVPGSLLLSPRRSHA